MVGRRKFLSKGLRAIVFLIGYILSPLTWWNDVFVNIPLAYIMASMLSWFFGQDSFPALFAGAYLFTNVLGFLLMHVSIAYKKRLSKRKLLIDIGIAVGYTVAIYVLAVLGFIKPF